MKWFKKDKKEKEFEPDKNYPNKLLIQPRDSYYESGRFKDWSAKLDISVPVQEQVLAETTYWKKTMDEITDINSKIITAQFYLTPQDIADFKFSDNIYCVIDGAGGYYKVNKISNYDPTDTRTTTVELLKTKVKDLTLFFP